MEVSSLNAAKIFPFRWRSGTTSMDEVLGRARDLVAYTLLYQLVIYILRVFQLTRPLVNRVQRCSYGP